jgi:non-homologous end joining protein Ku
VIREALNQKGMVAIGRMVFGSREYMIAIKRRVGRHDASAMPISLLDGGR